MYHACGTAASDGAARLVSGSGMRRPGRGARGREAERTRMSSVMTMTDAETATTTVDTDECPEDDVR